MNDMDERLAQTFSDHAPVFVRSMPKGTVVQVRARQAVASLATLSAVAILVIGVIGTWSLAAKSNRPASQETVPAPSGLLPNPQGQEGGVNDATPAPADSNVSEDTTAHGTNSNVPYTEQVNGQEAYLLTAKHVVALGHVSGVEWTVAGYDTQAYTGDKFPRFLGGSCGDLMVGDQGEYGGITFCLHTPETSPDAQFAMAGFGNSVDPNVGPIAAYAGLVASDVAKVKLRLVGGDDIELPLYDAASGIGVRYFAVFVDAGTDGRIVALGDNGTELGSGGLCVSEPPERSDNVGCGHGLEDVSSVVSSLRPEPTLDG
jgi:hypothetical protein